MAKPLDLYSILRSYALKNNSAMIDLAIFVKFLKHNAERDGEKGQRLSEWANGTKEKVKTALLPYFRDGRCMLKTYPSGQKIFMPSFFIDKINQAYAAFGNADEMPFPDEKSLRLAIPEEHIRKITVETGLINYLNDPQKEELPILKLVFPKDFGEALALNSHLPRRIVEAAIVKVKGAFRKNNMLEFYRQKTLIHFPGQEPRVREFINIIMMRPMDCIDSLEEANEFSFAFWMFICPLIKLQVQDAITRSNDISPDDIALYQAATIMLVFNNYYKIVALNQREKDLAFAELEAKLNETPYIYTLSEMMQFKNKAGSSMIQKYSEADFEIFISKKMSSGENDRLPEMLRYTGYEGIEWLILKNKVWPLIEMQKKENILKIKDEITARWTQILKKYCREHAMDRDDAFESLVNRVARLYCPFLVIVLHDKKTAVLQEELLNDKDMQSKSAKYFEVGQPATLCKIFGYKREDFLTYCRYSLPFWFSFPFIVSLISFFKNGPGKKYVDDDDGQKDRGEGAAEATTLLKIQGEKIAADILPEGADIDTYINSVRDRWNQIINKMAQQRLTNDVHAITKDYMRQVLKMQGRNNINSGMLSDIAERIIDMNPPLAKINNRDALRLYIKLFITKLLITGKF
jgi:hypothetical protein